MAPQGEPVISTWKKACHQIQNGSEFPELVAQNFRNPHEMPVSLSKRPASLRKDLSGRPDLNRASCAQRRRVARTIICSRHSFDQNLLNSLDSARRRPLMIKLNSRLLTEGLAGASASQIADFLASARRLFWCTLGALS